MRHASLTCKNHPELRWSAKEIAVNSRGQYNGVRSIFFKGRVTDPVKFYSDMSGLDCERFIEGEGIVHECDCPASDLVFSPEDWILQGHTWLQWVIDKDAEQFVVVDYHGRQMHDEKRLTFVDAVNCACYEQCTDTGSQGPIEVRWFGKNSDHIVMFSTIELTDYSMAFGKEVK